MHRMFKSIYQLICQLSIIIVLSISARIASLTLLLNYKKKNKKKTRCNNRLLYFDKRGTYFSLFIWAHDK